MGSAEKLLADGERTLVVLRPHVRRMLRPALILLVLAPAAAFAAAVVPAGTARGPVRLVVTALAVLVTLRWVVWPFLLWWNTLYVLTDERFFERSGVARRMGHDLPLQGVTDVIVAQRFGERLLRSGTLRITTDGGGEMVVTDVPAVGRVERGLLAVADDITERLRAHRRKAEELDEAADPRPRDEVDPWGEAGEEWTDGWGEEPPDGWAAEDVEDGADDAPAVPSRSEARRRYRESRRRLAEIQAQVRRTPVPDSPLEDGGDDERAQAMAAHPAGRAADSAPIDGGSIDAGSDDDGPDDDGGSPDDDAGGARILRFPPRP